MNSIYFKEISSTNDYLKEHYLALPNWTILTTDYQSKGRGRLNHVWRAHKGENLLCSILIKDKKILESHECLVLLVGVSIYRLLKDLGIKNIRIKRPNDIYINKKKICGILLECMSLGDKLKALVIGVGLNLNQKSFPKTLKATSYYLEKNKEIDINKVKDKFITILKDELAKIKSGDYNRSLLNKYKDIICERI